MARTDDLRDLELTADVYDLLEHDCRLRGIGVQVEVRGGVAHVSGMVRRDEERWLLRRLIGRIRGIHAVWDVLRIPGEPPPRVIDIGCGNTKQLGWALGVDQGPFDAVDVVSNLESGLPLRDESVDQVFAIHVLEHVRELPALMNDIHRVLKPNGVLHAIVPNWQCVNAVGDPTHVRFFSSDTFKNFCLPAYRRSVFSPVAISSDSDTIFADLQPVKGDGVIPPEEMLARFFG